MPVPKRKRSRARRDSRFANKGMEVKGFGGCPTCKEPMASHQVCKACGHYKGIKVLVTKAERAEKRGVARKASADRAEARQPKQGQGASESGE